MIINRGPRTRLDLARSRSRQRVRFALWVSGGLILAAGAALAFGIW